MGSGTKKNVWPIGILIIAGVFIIGFAMMQNKAANDAVAVDSLAKTHPVALSSYSVSDSGSKAGEATEDPVTSPAIVATPEAGNQVVYAIQLYSFRDQTRADAITKDLNAGGIPAYVQMSDLGDKGIWYRVRTGAFDVPEKAQAMLAEIRKLHKDSIVVKEKK
ncbi:MAG: SPOR domain-containing protein [Candidatus Omnitrophica bacterium]|nr:SPOR domain-containing protein [Candidatus Omnitrophota bacterium]